LWANPISLYWKKEIFAFTSRQHLFDEKQEKKKHSKRIKMKKPKPIEEPEKPVKKKKNRKRWRKKKDLSSNLSSPDPDMASKVEQEEMHPPKDEWP
jgi:type II secretory pathway component GspD/PulD (secretin)